VPRPELSLRIHIPIALLAIDIRLLFSALSIFVHNNTFSLFGSSIVADVLMAIVEEFCVVVATLVLEFKLGRINPSMQGEIIDHKQKGRKHGHQLHGSKDGSYGQPSNSIRDILVRVKMDGLHFRYWSFGDRGWCRIQLRQQCY